jgi:Arc/MetJ-type ribon-helix-helix transcriptional regulator
MQTRVPPHIREAVTKDLERMEKDGVYQSESDWIREAVIRKLKGRKLF